MVAIISVSVGRRINFGPFAANYKRNQQDKEVKSMTRIDIISGFLGAGKTTLIKKLLGDALKGQQVVLIENEFGEIGIDGGFLKDAGIEIREMNSGCICCSLVGDFGAALKDVITKYHPDRIIIEPSGVGKLSDVIKAVDGVEKEAGVALNSATTVVDVMKCKMYLRNFGEFFENQVKSAGTIILSRTDKADTEKVEAAVKMLRELNPEAHIITTPVEVLGGKKVLDTMEGAIINLAQVEEHHHHHHDHDECGCGHDHDEEHEHHITIMMRTNMNIITTTMTASAAAATITTRSMSIITTTMITSVAAAMITTMSIIITTMTSAAAVMIIITIITQTKFSQAGVRRL